MENEFNVGEYIIYTNGDRFEIGRIKSLSDDGAFVCYHEGETAAKTPFDCMHKLVNGYCVKHTSLGGEVFEDTTQSIIGKWTYVETRELTEKEKSEWEEQTDAVPEYMFSCALPDDGESVILLTKWGIDVDECCWDNNMCYLDNRGDWDGVVAWMPATKLIP